MTRQVRCAFVPVLHHKHLTRRTQNPTHRKSCHVIVTSLQHAQCTMRMRSSLSLSSVHSFDTHVMLYMFRVYAPENPSTTTHTREQNRLTSEQSATIIKAFAKLPKDFELIVYPTLITVITDNAAAEQVVARDFDLTVITAVCGVATETRRTCGRNDYYILRWQLCECVFFVLKTFAITSSISHADTRRVPKIQAGTETEGRFRTACRWRRCASKEIVIHRAES